MAALREYRIASPHDLRQVESVWQSCRSSFGSGKFMRFEHGDGSFTTNLSLDDTRVIARHACVRLPDYLTGIADDDC